MGRSRVSNWVRNDTCEAHKKLSQMFLDKNITPSTKPSDLLSADKDFQNYSLLSVPKQLLFTLKV